MARCLVTGGAGFIGSHVVDALIEKGHEVYVIDDFSTGKRENVNPKARLIEMDIRYKSLFKALPKAEYVFHLAALARIQPSIKDPLTSHNVNVVGTLNVLEYCRANGAKIIFSGSSSIYGNTVLGLPISERSNKNPGSPYALQKLQCEEYIKLYNKLYGVDYTIFRYFNVYGERQILDGAYAAVVGIFLAQRAAGKPLTVTGDGEQERDFTYVKDVVDANIRGMHWEGTFNIGTGTKYSMNQLAEFVGGPRKYLPARQGEARQTLADISKAKEMGWEPKVDIEDWIYDQV